MSFFRIAAGIAAATGLAAIGNPAAASITLDYQGLPFTSIGSPAAGTGISGYIVVKDFDTSVGQQLLTPDLLDWSISNGAYTLSKANGNALTRFDMLTDAGGKVRQWAFDAQDRADATWTEFSRTDSGNLDISVIKDNSYSGESENVGPSGAWTLASGVPEPATWAMMLTGFGLAGAAVRGSRRKSAKA